MIPNSVNLIILFSAIIAVMFLWMICTCIALTVYPEKYKFAGYIRPTYNHYTKTTTYEFHVNSYPYKSFSTPVSARTAKKWGCNKRLRAYVWRIPRDNRIVRIKILEEVI